jgi:hypothetical protein
MLGVSVVSAMASDPSTIRPSGASCRRRKNHCVLVGTHVVQGLVLPWYSTHCTWHWCCLLPVVAVVEQQLHEPWLLPALEDLEQNLTPDRRLRAIVGDALRLPEVGHHAVCGFRLDHGRELRVRKLLCVQRKLVCAEDIVPTSRYVCVCVCV